MFLNKKLAVAVSGAVLLMAGQFALADSTTDIVDALVSKGVLTEEEGKLISKGHETKKKAEGNIGFKNGFKINSGDGKSNFSVNGRIQADYRYFDTSEVSSRGGEVASAIGDTFDIRRAYVGVKGTFRDFINFEATVDAAGTSAYVKYYWLETAFSDKVKVRFGQFKPAFGLEQNTSSRFIDMTERDWVASMAPGVNKGIMIHGSPFTGVNYGLTMSNGSVATYLADSSQKAAETSSNADGKQYSANLRVNVAEIMGNKEAIMHVGGSIAADTDVAKPVSGSMAFRTNARGTAFYSIQTGFASNTIDITRAGLEGIGAYGPFKLQAEWAQMGFSNTNVTETNDKDINAWYVNASYMLTGEKYASAYKGGVMDRLTPNADFLGLDKPGWGAWELGLRYSKFDAKDIAQTSNTVATANGSNNVNSYTAGIKWITDPNSRFMLDYVYTDFSKYITGYQVDSSSVSAAPAYKNEKAINFRAQFDF